jgi:hypothetical protein
LAAALKNWTAHATGSPARQMKDERGHLDDANALALLPVSVTLLDTIREILERTDEGEFTSEKGLVKELVQVNKQTRFSTQSWGRLSEGRRKNDLWITCKFIYFDGQNDPEDYFYSAEVHRHGTPQSPMLSLCFDRMHGPPPIDYRQKPDSYVVSRRIVSVPLQCVLRSWGDATKGHMIYEHNISAMDHADPQFTSLSYIGLTARNWQSRYREHKRDALTGSELLFHTSLSKVFVKDGIVQAGMGPIEVVRRGICFLSELQYVNLSFEKAMQVEEFMVSRTLHPAGLNMIPGGFAGMKFLHQHNLLNRKRSSLEERDRAAAAYLIQNNRSDKLAPWVRQNWERDDFYERVILNRKQTLNREQVLAIREYGSSWGFAPDLIASLVGANLRQVRDVLRGKYYARVRPDVGAPNVS